MYTTASGTTTWSPVFRSSNRNQFYGCPIFMHGIPDSKVHGANMRPIWVLSAPDGPHVGHMNLAFRDGTRIVSPSSGRQETCPIYATWNQCDGQNYAFRIIWETPGYTTGTTQYDWNTFYWLFYRPRSKLFTYAPTSPRHQRTKSNDRHIISNKCKQHVSAINASWKQFSNYK